MLLTPVEFGQIAQGMGVVVLIAALITGIAFVRQWGWRFRLVGITSFSVVLTVGLFALSIAPITRTSVSGSVRYSLVYDRYGAQAVISVPPTVTAPQLEATLKQAADNLFSSGRSGHGENQLTIRARTVVHLSDALSQPVYIGQVKRSLHQRNDPNMEVQIYPEQLAELARFAPNVSE
ncbi:Ycf51 family protein [Tumidithrix helvetica PCC 7403]|uniref:Ycf51 family protein n=1 Tax=Tumidithrix helvetica TaxID=3457545 RepID=UPI003C95506E